MKSRILFVVLALALSTVACGQSPLFNHDTANPAGAAADPTVKTQFNRGECPLPFPKSGLCASLEWLKIPAGDETGSFMLRFWSHGQGSKDGPYTEPASAVAVKLWMPAMGHGSSPVRVAHAMAPDASDLPGQFDATDVFFVMPGAWELHIQLKNGPIVIEEFILPYQA